MVQRRVLLERLPTPVILPSVVITEVTPWASGNAPYGADWFEVTNIGAGPVDVTGWRMDDDSGAFATAVALSGITSIAAGESVIFIETSNLVTTTAAFLTAWFGANPPADLQVGSYSGSGVGLSTGGDSVNLFDASGNRITGVRVGASTTGFTFDNAAGLGSTTPPLPTVSTLSIAGVNGAFLAADGAETGSPGTIENPDVTPPVIDPVTDLVVEATGPTGAIVAYTRAGHARRCGRSRRGELPSCCQGRPSASARRPSPAPRKTWQAIRRSAHSP